MILIKDWKKYSELMALGKEVGQKGLIGCFFGKVLFGRVFSRDEATVEGCLNWIVKGRPVWVKKLKVKHL